ncbi:hypothetical protein, partial [Streptococcus suis]|uniref:hypothetical protein n=1 Tax=Streptococcus suis TaxID=1307 RepID=UPI003CF690A5
VISSSRSRLFMFNPLLFFTLYQKSTRICWNFEQLFEIDWNTLLYFGFKLLGMINVYYNSPQ